CAPQAGGHHYGGDDIGGGEERRELGARNQLNVAQRRAFSFGLPAREARRFTARKPGRNQALITIWCLVHPLAAPRLRDGVDKERLRPVKAVLFRWLRKLPPQGPICRGRGSPAGDKAAALRHRSARRSAAPIAHPWRAPGSTGGRIYRGPGWPGIAQVKGAPDRTGCRPPDRATRSAPPYWICH